MTLAKPAFDEDARLAALAAYRIMDTPPERAFDDAALVAATLCSTPIALVSLVDDERQWFKARYGLGAVQTPREQSFCAHTLGDRQTLIVDDTHADARFRDNPLVVGAPHIRFYAGAPLVNDDGHALGTLCVIDRAPRQPTAAQVRALEALARLVVDALEQRRQGAELASALEQARVLRGNLPVCAWCKQVRDDDGRWLPIDDYLVKLSDKPVSHALCARCAERYFPDTQPPLATD